MITINVKNVGNCCRVMFTVQWLIIDWMIVMPEPANGSDISCWIWKITWPNRMLWLICRCSFHRLYLRCCRFYFETPCLMNNRIRKLKWSNCNNWQFVYVGSTSSIYGVWFWIKKPEHFIIQYQNLNTNSNNSLGRVKCTYITTIIRKSTSH